MTPSDPTNGYEAIAHAFMAARSAAIGVAAVRAWAGLLPAGSAVLDVGAGHGAPLAEALLADGYAVHGVEPSSTLAAAFARRLPQAAIACEPAEASSFFNRRFPGVMAIGLLFLLEPEAQEALLPRLAAALEPGGSLLFTAPRQACAWRDALTGRLSRSLGEAAYARALAAAGLRIVSTHADEGGNDYFEARLSPPSGSCRD